MNPTEKQNRAAVVKTVLPALIQIQEPLPVTQAADAGRRRICVLLDHPVARYLGTSSWVLVGVAAAAARPITAAIAAVLIFAGLLIGLVNGLRWLLGPK